jgi:hypothetical protein
LGRIHALKVFFKILAAEIRSEGDDFLDACRAGMLVCIPVWLVKERVWELTGIFGIFWANIIITRVKNVLVHKSRARRHLPEKRDLDWLANLDSLALLDENLSSVLATIFAIKRRYAILFWVVTFFERLESCHKIVPSSHAVGNDTLGDTSGNCAFYNSCDGIHRPDHFRLELRRHVEFDLLE